MPKQKNRPPYRHIIFDLDGTLTDSAAGVIGSVCYALQKMGLEADTTELKTFIGPPLQRSFRERYGFNEEQVWQAIGYFREYYREKGIYENRLYPGAAEMLHSLAGAGKRIYLATSKATPYAETILKHFAIDRYFSFLAGATLDGARVEKKDVLAHLLEENRGLEPANTVMVGDHRDDIIGARKFGLASIAVTYGYGSEEELGRERPDRFARSIPELTDLLLAPDHLKL